MGIRSSLATLVLLTASLASTSDVHAQIAACNIAQIRTWLSSHPSDGTCTGQPNPSNPCVLKANFICAASCPGSTCSYDVYEDDVELKLEDSGQLTAGSGKSIRVTGTSISTGASGTATRFLGGGAGTSVSLQAAGTSGDILVFGKMINPGGTVNVNAIGDVSVRNVDVSTAVSGQTGGLVTIYGNDFAEVAGNGVEASGPAGGGTVRIRSGNHVEVNASVTARATTSGTSGTVSVESFSYDEPGTVTVTSKIAADAQGTSTGNGGTVHLGAAVGAFEPPALVDLRAEINVGSAATNSRAGTVSMDGVSISVAGAGSLKGVAGSSSKTGTIGGTVLIEGVGGAGDTVTVDDIDVRGETAGSVTILSDSDITVNQQIDASSNKNPSGKGGTVAIRPRSFEASPPSSAAWDCGLPGEAPSCPRRFSGNCAHAVYLNDSVLAHGNGSSGTAGGVGGVISLEAPRVFMRQAGTSARELQANAHVQVDGIGGTTPGTVRVRARNSLFSAQTSSGIAHKVRALPDKTGCQFLVSQPLGGSFMPNELSSCTTPETYSCP